MKLFISYSRDDLGWVFQLWAALRDKARYEVWLDQRTHAGARWWSTILTHLAESDCIVYVMTPHAIESPYCREELNYALALNKPIVPLMLKPCDYPTRLAEIQYYSIDQTDSISETLVQILPAFGEIKLDLRTTDKYKPPDPLPTPPPDPLRSALPQVKPLAPDLFEVYKQAEIAVSQGDIETAQRLFGQVIAADPEGLGVSAQDRLDEIQFERERDQAYQQVVGMWEDPQTRNGTAALWRRYVQKYGPDYDPKAIGEQISAKTPPPRPKYDPIQDAIARAWDFQGTKNRDWTPFVTTFPDWPIPNMAFCLVPIGSFMMGDNNSRWSNESPAHSQTIQRPYWIAQTPVTNQQWKEAVKAGWVSDPPDHSSLGTDIGQWYRDPAMADCPVVGISWFAALAFCQAIGGLLPNERDWEYAARGVQSWVYPWGDDWEDGEKAVWRGNSGGKPNPVTHKPEGASWVGAVHLSGNVWEWCSTLYDDFSYPYQENDERDNLSIIDKTRVVRGGSWVNYGVTLRAANRSRSEPPSQYGNLGFRCARFLDS